MGVFRLENELAVELTEIFDTVLVAVAYSLQHGT